MSPINVYLNVLLTVRHGHSELTGKHMQKYINCQRLDKEEGVKVRQCSSMVGSPAPQEGGGGGET